MPGTKTYLPSSKLVLAMVVCCCRRLLQACEKREVEKGGEKREDRGKNKTK
jgi:hypothetical protein